MRTGEGPPKGMGYYPTDPPKAPVCATCKSDNVFYEGGKLGYCYECEDNREIEDEE